MQNKTTDSANMTFQRYIRAEEVRAAHSWLKSQGLHAEMLERSSLSAYLVALSLVWTGIGWTVALGAAWGWPVCLASILVLGYLQRALGNLLHDVAHSELANRRAIRGGVAVLVALPMLTTLGEYRTRHFTHHRHLGDPSRDCDFIHQPDSLRRGSFRAFLTCACSQKAWIDSLLGQLAKPGTPKITILLWWLVVCATLWLLFGYAVSLIFLVLWFGARGTSFHLITIFREMADHVGLQPGGILSFTRNSPTGGILRHCVHPFANGFHIAHHLFPRVPFFRLLRLHRILLRWPPYAAAENCGSYFGRPLGQACSPSVFVSLSGHYVISSELAPARGELQG